MHGLVLVVDATDETTAKTQWKDVAQVLSNDEYKGKPLLVIGNHKSVSKGATGLTAIQLADLLGLAIDDDMVKVVVSNLVANESDLNDVAVIEGVTWLCESISTEYNGPSQLEERVANAVLEQEAKQKKEAEERRLRVEKLKKEREEKKKMVAAGQVVPEAKKTKEGNAGARKTIYCRYCKDHFPQDQWRAADRKSALYRPCGAWTPLCTHCIAALKKKEEEAKAAAEAAANIEESKRHPVGSAVRATVEGWNQSYPGKIESYNGDGTYVVAFDDGDRQPQVQHADITAQVTKEDDKVDGEAHEEVDDVARPDEVDDVAKPDEVEDVSRPEAEEGVEEPAPAEAEKAGRGVAVAEKEDVLEKGGLKPEMIVAEEASVSA